jgi:hypothetical protein
MTPDDICDLHDQLAGFDDIVWIDDAARDIVERFMPDLASRLPEKRTETFDQAFGRVRARSRHRSNQAAIVVRLLSDRRGSSGCDRV